MSKTIAHTALLATLEYDQETGHFVRRGNPKILGGDNGQGYLIICLSGQRYRAHRLAVFYVTGQWPAHEVDHINGNRSDNRWENLRLVTGNVNSQNRREAQKNSSTGLLGVRPFRGRFRSVIALNHKRKHLGTFETAIEAHQAYVAAKRLMHEGCTI